METITTDSDKWSAESVSLSQYVISQFRDHNSPLNIVGGIGGDFILSTADIMEDSSWLWVFAL